jgi:poly(A) polymerase
MNNPEKQSSLNTLITNETCTLLAKISSVLASIVPTAYLVGGSVRNLLLGHACSDWDIVLPTHGRALAQVARTLANELGGFYAHLHEKADRVIIKDTPQEMIIDLAPMDGPSIESDLARRDFTVNAIAVPLHAFVQWLTANLNNDCTDAIEQLSSLCIDPYQGIADSHAHRLRAVSDTIFTQDPLRMLRAVRLSTHYQLIIDEHTSTLIRRDAHCLPQVASERVYAELVSILEPAGAAQRLLLLDDLQLLTEIFPELIPLRGLPQSSSHHQDVFNHSIETVATLERLAQLLYGNLSAVDLPTSDIRLKPAEIAEIQNVHTLLQEAQQQGLYDFADGNKAAMKLAALLHDIGKSSTYKTDGNGVASFPEHETIGRTIANRISQRLHIPAHERRLIIQVIAHHSRPYQLAQESLTPLAMHRYFVELGAIGISVALIALAAALSTYDTPPRPSQWQQLLTTTRFLLSAYIRERQRILPSRLLQGNELIQQFDLQAGPLIGRLLTILTEAQVTGQIHTREEALGLVRQWLQHYQ